MPYVEVKTIAGNLIEIDRHYTYLYHKAGSRLPKSNKTKESQKKINDRKAARKLHLLINANFQENDFYITLTYPKGTGTKRTPEEMKSDFAKFTRKLRKVYQKAGKDLKYIHVMEIGSHGARHHHIILNSIQEPQLITQIWNDISGHGYSKIELLYSQGHFENLANYMVKQTSKYIGTDNAITEKRYSCSKNLKQPIVIRTIISRNRFYVTPRAKEGYVIDKESIRTGVNMLGFEYLRFVMFKRQQAAAYYSMKGVAI